MKKLKLIFLLTVVSLFLIGYTASAQDNIVFPLTAKSIFQGKGIIFPDVVLTTGDSCNNPANNPEKHDGPMKANGYGWLSDSGRFVIKFSPGTVGHSTPWIYNKVCVGWQGLGGTPTNVPYTIVAYDSTPTGPGALLYVGSVQTAASVPPYPTTTWFSSVENIPVTHAVYIGIRIRLATSPYTLVSSDENVATPLWPGYTSISSPPAPWQTIQSVGTFAGYRCLGIRTEGASASTTGWVEQITGTVNGINCISAVSDQIGWAGANGGFILRTINGGTTWTNVSSGPIGTAAVYAVCGLDANTCLASTSPGATFVYKTTNGGVLWTQVFTQAGGFIDDIKMFNATNGIMYGDPVGGRWEMYKTSNAGTTWDSTGLYIPQAGTEAGWNNAMCVRGTNVWFGTNNTKLYYSSNSGTSWTAQPTTGSVNTYSVSFDGSIGMCGESAALRSTNLGSTWSVLSAPGTGSIFGFGNALAEFWYGRGDTLYYSSNDGSSFAMQYKSPGGTYQATSFVIANNVVRGWAGTSLGTISMYNEVLNGININNNKVPDNFSLSQNYPNPFNPSTKIDYQIPKANNVKIVVFDILGKEVATMVNEFKQAGSYKVDFNASNLASGVYLYKISAGDFTSTKKMLLVK